MLVTTFHKPLNIKVPVLILFRRFPISMADFFIFYINLEHFYYFCLLLHFQCLHWSCWNFVFFYNMPPCCRWSQDFFPEIFPSDKCKGGKLAIQCMRCQLITVFLAKTLDLDMDILKQKVFINLMDAYTCNILSKKDSSFIFQLLEVCRILIDAILNE